MRLRTFNVTEDGSEVTTRRTYSISGVKAETGDYCRAEDALEIENKCDFLEDRLDTASIRFNFAADWLAGLLCENGTRKAELLCYLRECAQECKIGEATSTTQHSPVVKKLLNDLGKPNNGL